MGTLTWLVLILLAGRSYSDHLKGCFFTDWSQNRIPFDHFPKDIDANLCTHVFFAYAKLVDSELELLEEDDETSNIVLYDRVNDLKKENPHLKTILSVGGSKAGTEEMSKMLSTKENRAHFVENAVKYLRDRSFDGLDLHFEYPGRGSSPIEDKQRLALLAKDLHEAFSSKKSPSDSKLILTATVSGVQENVDKAYEVEQLNEFVDYFNLMTYDYHGSWEPITGHNAPLFSEEDNLSLNWSAKYWVSKGVNPSKILLGMPGYGRCFNLKSPEEDGIGAPVTGPCQAGEFTKEDGLLSYFEICKLFKESTTKVEWSKSHQVPYLVNKNVWVGFDNERSLKLKADYIKEHGLGGWFFWDTSMDDFKGSSCGQGAYPLLKTLSEILDTTELPTSDSSSPSTSRMNDFTNTTGRTNTTDSKPTTGRISTTGRINTTGRIPTTSRTNTTGRIPTTGRTNTTGRVPTTGRTNTTGRIPTTGRTNTTGRIPTTIRTNSTGRISTTSRTDHVLIAEEVSPSSYSPSETSQRSTTSSTTSPAKSEGHHTSTDHATSIIIDYHTTTEFETTTLSSQKIDLLIYQETSATTVSVTTSTTLRIRCYGLPDGDYKHPQACHSFLTCSNKKTPRVIQCPDNLYFDDITKRCSYSYELSEERQRECGVIASTTPELTRLETATLMTPDVWTTITLSWSPLSPGMICDGKTDEICKHETDCHSFVKVFDGIIEVLRCPGNLYFDELKTSCTSKFELHPKRKVECQIN